MAQFLYWLDRGSFAAMLQHAWVWAVLVGVVALANVVGIAAILRHYDGQSSD
jgi:hypothetical protein